MGVNGLMLKYIPHTVDGCNVFFILLIVLLTAFPCYGWHSGTLGAGVSAAADPCASYLVCQGFEGAGYDNSESWTEAGAGTKDEDYTTIHLVGDQSLAMVSTDWSQTNTSYVSFTAQDNAYSYFQFQVNSTTASQNIMMLADSSGNNLCYVALLSTDVLHVDCGGTADTVGTLSINTTYHIWVEHEKGTGANGHCRVAFSTDGSKPASGNNFAESSECTGTAQTARLLLGGYAETPTTVMVFDKARVKSTAIGANPD